MQTNCVHGTFNEKRPKLNISSFLIKIWAYVALIYKFLGIFK
jgi:hypothetical protein